MRRAVNSTEVARRAGVSRTTVSFVLNGREDSGRIPPATRDRVLRAAEEMGYSPNHIARVLISGRSFLINLLVRHVNPTFFARAIESFNAVLQGTGYDLHIQETAAWTEENWKAASNGRWPVDGMIVLEEAGFIPHLTGVEPTERIPVVSVGSAYSTEVDHVGIDLQAGAAEAVRHLVATGRQRIAFLGPNYTERMTRWIGFSEEMLRLGREPALIRSEPSWSHSERALARWAVETALETATPFDALFCFNDEYAIGALRALKDRGLRIPDDVALVGCDDIEETEYHDPPLSTLHYPYEEAAKVAWEMLRRRIDAPALPRQSMILTPKLMVRRSSVITADGRQASTI
jgi:DNA-binding LacI/PurR family transcriptional regulator